MIGVSRVQDEVDCTGVAVVAGLVQNARPIGSSVLRFPDAARSIFGIQWSKHSCVGYFWIGGVQCDSADVVGICKAGVLPSRPIVVTGVHAAASI